MTPLRKLAEPGHPVILATGIEFHTGSKRVIVPGARTVEEAQAVWDKQREKSGE